MWREWSTHQRKNSEFLSEAVERVRTPTPAVAGLWRAQPGPSPRVGGEVFLLCPQSADTHAEGPLVEDHLQLMRQVLLAVVEGKLHLGDIEEFRRLKGFAGEFDEIEETIKEKAASLEVFILCHDLGKPETICFAAHEGSEGANKGFHDSLSDILTHDNKNRTVKIKRYNQEYKKFVTTFDSSEEAYAAFLSSHQISISYPGYAAAIAQPKFREALTKISLEFRLTAEDTEDVFHLILLHEKVLNDFLSKASSAAYNHLIKYALKYGRDTDDFLDLLLAATFLEICGAPRLKAHGITYDAVVINNFLVSEHESLPGKRGERLKKRRDKQLKVERTRFREAGLDGNDLMKLLGMKPGPEFGKILIAIQMFAKGETAIPVIPETAKAELFKRVEKFRQTPTPGPSPKAERGGN
ncbi:MAG: hypothetical protein V1664_01500 [Candidatus Uhrbacteria bacterium]